MKRQKIQLPKKTGQKRWVQTMDYKILHRKLKTGDHHLQCWWMLSSLYSSFKSLNVICKWFCLAVNVPNIQGIEIGPIFNLKQWTTKYYTEN
jgi:hypothetical protein